MAYQPQVVNAKLVSRNEKNGFSEVVVDLADRNQARLMFEKDPVSGKDKATHINRLYTVPCAICKKDFLCFCLNRYKDDIAEQALSKIGQPS